MSAPAPAPPVSSGIHPASFAVALLGHAIALAAFFVIGHASAPPPVVALTLEASPVSSTMTRLAAPSRPATEPDTPSSAPPSFAASPASLDATPPIPVETNLPPAIVPVPLVAAEPPPQPRPAPSRPRPTRRATPPLPRLHEATAAPAEARGPTAQPAPTPNQPDAAGQVTGGPSGPATPSASLGADWRNSLGAWLQEHRHYPDGARQRGDEGRAVIRFTASRDGTVLSYTLVSSSGSALLDEAAQAIFRSAHLPPFPASMTNSQITVTVPIRFTLER